MRQYLGFKRQKNGAGEVVAVWGRIRHKKHPHAELKHEQHWSTKENHLIIGADNAGKSRWISKLKRESAYLWRGRPVLVIRSIDSLNDWFATLPQDTRKNLLEAPKCAAERIHVLGEYVKNGILIVDDVHRLTGRKVDYVHELMSSASLFVVSSTSHHKIHPKIRATIERRRPVVHDLESGTTYDATMWLVWLFIIGLFVAGAPEAAVLTGGATLLRSGAKSRGQV